MTFLLRSTTNHKCYPCLYCCVPFRTEDALNKHLELCNTQKYSGRRTFHINDYLKFDEFHYNNRAAIDMYYDSECIIKDRKHCKAWTMSHIPIACGIHIKIDYPDILEEKYEKYFGKDIVDWFLVRMRYYNKIFKETICLKIQSKEDSITPLYTNCYYCNHELGTDIVRDHDHLDGKFTWYAHNKGNLQDNHLFVTILAKKIRLKILTKTDKNYICIDIGHAKASIRYV